MSAALQTLAVILLPIAIPFVKKQWLQLQLYKHTTPRPFTVSEYRQLVLIILCCTVYAVLLFKEFLRSETDVFRLTDSRLAISTDVLKRRCHAANLSLPETLWTMLEAPEMRLAYLRLGAEPLLNCAWCSMNQINSYFYYSLGPIMLAYLAHLAILSICTRHQSVAALSMVAAFGVEAYARSGGADKFNARTKRAEDVLYIASFASLARTCFFIWTLAMASLKLWFDAQFPLAQPSLEQVRGDLIASIETLRASNAMRRTIGDTEELRNHVVAFWTRNEAATRKLDQVQDLVNARTEAAGRFGNVKAEEMQAKVFVEQCVDRVWQ